MQATYSPDDNKLRLYSISRLDSDTYARVRNAGFIYAPKQGLFVAPMWTPAREDLLIELCGEIGDEDTSLVDRAEQRAERFEEYSEHRSNDADMAHKAVSAIVEHIPLGQPILVGHHSERRARKDAERIDNGMRRAVKMWETSQYWQSRAEGALRHAKYKELPAVRARRIKKIEADKRKRERDIQEARNFLAQWNSPDHELTLERAKHITSVAYVSACFPLAKYPRELPASQYEGQMSIWSALDGGVINEVQAKKICVRVYERTIAWSQRWLDHYENRLTYERAMLGESGGLAADKFDLQVGGYVKVKGDWLLILRVNRKDGKIMSVSTDCPYVSVKPVEKIQDYQPPTEPLVKPDCPLLNYRAPEGVRVERNCYRKEPTTVRQVTMTKSEYRSIGKDYRGTDRVADGSHKVRFAIKAGERVAVYLSDSKIHPIPASKEKPVAPAPAPVALPDPIMPQVASEPNVFDAMKETLRNGGVQVVAAPQLFVTPPAPARRVVKLADIRPGNRVLEPNAGTGALLRAIYDNVGGCDVVRVTAVEVSPALVSALEADRRLRNGGGGIRIYQRDFLTCKIEELGKFDRIVMNPPFVNAEDIKHILHARTFLEDGGKLVAICANGPRQRDQLMPIADEWIDLESGAFTESGTNINAAICVFSA